MGYLFRRLSYPSPSMARYEIPKLFCARLRLVYPSELLADALRLTHPDHHPPERQDLAHRVTQQLLSLQPFVFPAPKPPKPVTPPSAPQIKDREVTSKTPRFPCKDCAATGPAYYCAACSAEWNKRQQGKHSRECAKRRAQYRHRKQRLALTRSPKQCMECGRKLNGKRKDARFCSNSCRQRTHRKTVTANSTHPADYQIAVTAGCKP
jgi:hypothetical protein